MPPMLEAQIWQWPLNRINPSGATYMFEAQQAIPGRGKRALRERLMERRGRGRRRCHPGSRPRHRRRRQADVCGDLRRPEGGGGDAGDVDLLRQIAEGTQVRYAAGRGSQQDILKAVVEITRLHEEEVIFVEQARMAEARLNTLLGRDPGLPVGTLAEPQEDAALPPVADLQRLAIERQPELAMALAEIAVAEAAVDVVRSERRRDYFVRGGYMLMPGEAGAFTAGVGITWNNAPWSRGRNDLAEEEARLGVQARRAAYDAAVNNLRLMVQEAYIRVEAAARRAALLRTSLVPQSSQALDVSRLAYQADRGEFLDIIDNQRMLAAARLGYYRALADLERARADLDRAVGLTALGRTRQD
jgi:outer membrane protein, heavy metal efflux system